MKIKQITIKNFRSIKSALIEADNFNVFVGQNNHGKTNLFEEIDWFYTGKGDIDKTHFRKLGGKAYTKNCSVFDQILEKQPEAIKNAKQIFQANKVENNPSTAVFKLVEEINRIFRSD